MPAIAKAVSQQTVKGKKRRRAKRKKPRQLRLKGSLKTPEDWARFDAWVQVNALPKKIPEPEIIKRTAKPLTRFKKRIKVLAKPKSVPSDDVRCIFRAVSKAALHAKPSKRTKRLARPKIRLGGLGCKELTISRAALRYKASEVILDLSRPKLRLDPQGCRASPFEISRRALKRKTTEKDDELARPPKRFKSDEDEEERRRCKEKTDEQWLEYLALPKYRYLMGQETENAKKWREQILDGLDVRGKQALEEQKKKRAEEKRKDLQAQKSKSTIAEMSYYSEDGEYEYNEEYEEFEEPCPEPMEPYEMPEEEKEERRKRRMENEPWRFVKTTGCKEFPPKITKAALNYQASENTSKLAEPKKRRANLCKKGPGVVKKAALTAQSTPLIDQLAKPKHQAEPVVRVPPRELDEYGRPIIPKPAYGKELPKVKPYKTAECKEKKDEETEAAEEEERKEEVKKKKPIDPIVNKATIDPLFDPVGAEKQARERKRAAELEAEKIDEPPVEDNPE